MKGLRASQRASVATIEGFIAEHGYPPTIRELGSLWGVRSTNAVACRLRHLERRGYLEIEPHRVRGIRVVKRARVFVAPARDDGGRVYFPREAR
jgi:repressor LexA